MSGLPSESLKGSSLHCDGAFEKALARAMKFCSQAEKCSFQVRRYLCRCRILSRCLSPEEIESVLDLLVEEGFVDDRRFAMAYASDKMRLFKWGSVKVRNSLSGFGIGSDIIDEAVLHGLTVNRLDSHMEDSEADHESLEQENLRQLVGKKLVSLLRGADYKSLDYEQKQKLYAKLFRFAIGRGYESRDVSELLAQVPVCAKHLK